MKRLNLKYIIPILAVFLGPKVFGQINPMGSIYFQNQYLANPAMAGTEMGWELNMGYKAQWTAIEGAPAMASVTAAYGSTNKKTGFGFDFFNDQASIIHRTSAKATYAYHLPLNANSYLDFGLSVGIMNESIDLSKARGDLTDLSLYNFNLRNTYFDGGFGMAYRDNKLTVQASLPNLKHLRKTDMERKIADRALYFASASYKFINDKESALHCIEPKVVFRGIENYKDILDAGANLQFFGDKLLLSGMYHSTNSVTIGAGTIYKNKLTILAQYTTNTSDLQTYSNGEFEVGLKYNFR